MIAIPPGQFVMGSPDGEPERNANEGPLHAVAIGRGFAVSATEVTRAAYAAFAADTRRPVKGPCYSVRDHKFSYRAEADWNTPGFAQTPSDPVVCVSWDEAKAYAAWLGAKTGLPYRLLSEAEWEYAARAGTTAARPWGDDADRACAFANTADLSAKDEFPDWPVSNCRDGYVFTAPAGSFQPNGFGLHDMIGNVWEWTEDCYAPSYTDAPTDGSARQMSNCQARSFRGGSWDHVRSSARAASRFGSRPDFRGAGVGFRVARPL